MKRFLLIALLLILAIPTAEAKRRETEEEIAMKTRHNEGWEWGAQARASLIFYEMDYMAIKGQSPQTAYKAHAKFGGNILLNAGYHLTNHWRLGVETGVQIQYNYKAIVPLYLTAHYFYGKRKNCLFNFVNVGTNMLFNSVSKSDATNVAYVGDKKFVRFGATGAGGIGVRLQSPNSSDKVDIMIGYQALLLSPRPVINGSFGYKPQDVKRLELNQQVFIGVGITF
ncbi:MAG: hypothetical protein IIV52_04145 [Alistipes sp.]|jgi:hypothetical protein|nr:hypothetical protein [Alistipes sp.]